MSDYLYNLVARTLEQTEVVQPRPRARFEPDGAGFATTAAALELEEQQRGPQPGPALRAPALSEAAPEAGAPPALALTPRLDPGALPPPRPALPAAAQHHVGREAVAEVRPTETARPAGPPPADPAPPEAWSPERSVRPPAEEPAGDLARRRLTPAPSAPERAPGRQVGAVRQPATPAAPARRDAPWTAERVEKSLPPAPAPQAAEQPASPPPERAPALARPEQARPAPRPAEERQETRRQQPRETTVRITIGRIEVRAPQRQSPRPPRAASAPRKPARSLDDYLKKRSGGGS